SSASGRAVESSTGLAVGLAVNEGPSLPRSLGSFSVSIGIPLLNTRLAVIVAPLLGGPSLSDVGPAAGPALRQQLAAADGERQLYGERPKRLGCKSEGHLHPVRPLECGAHIPHGQPVIDHQGEEVFRLIWVLRPHAWNARGAAYVDPEGLI